jgi:hypothetical protein
MSLAAGLLILTHAVTARAEVVARKPSESEGDFMARVLGPSIELDQKVVRSTEIAHGKLALIGFVNFQDDSPDHSKGGDALVGHLLIESSPDQYEHVIFPSCDEESGAPELLAVFFARTAKGGGRDLAVLCGWDSHGMCYAAQFYRVKDGGSKTVVDSVSDLDKKFVTCDAVDWNKRGKSVEGSKAQFKTVAQVKKLLTKMGLKQ